MAAARVEARGTPPSAEESKNQWTSMFVFGDDFADNGNLPKLPGGHSQSDLSRQWIYPYGSYINSRGSAAAVPTGRFSNNKIQSDFIARILGLNAAPPAYMHTLDQSCDPTGMTFASGGAGVFQKKVPTLAAQVKSFMRLIKSGIISKEQLRHSVALVAISGNDYMSGADVKNSFLSSFDDIDTYIGNVTTEIVKNVEQLQKMGVKKVLVNNMHPIGCTPLRTSPNNYTACDILGNYAASVHNKNLKQLMDKKNNAYMLDLYTAFTDIINHAPVEGSDQSNNKFNNNLAPCCEGFYDTGFCGQQGDTGEPLYELCENPDQLFYWDEVHPTHAGWKAVMKALEQPLKEFLDRDYVA
ncbi:hypothetical protein ZWY2020_000219 [Hordeum vulgare]|nr:hypothetical protein ZWY2020_000219 [Hordeum vulgare]